MKIKNTLLGKGLLLAVSSLIGISSASAALTAQNGDLFIAFRASSGQGSDVSYIVNVGKASNYATATGTINLSVGNTGADLAATFGSGWATRSDLSWGVYGVTTAASNTLYASKERDSVFVQTTPWSVITTANRGSVGSAIDSVTNNAFNGYVILDPTGNSSVAGIQSNLPGSGYNYQVTGNSTTDFGSLSNWSSIEGDFANGASGTVLDLYRFTNSTTYLGSFSISNTGQISFAAVPEPTVSLLGAAGAVALLGRRRRRQNA